MLKTKNSIYKTSGTIYLWTSFIVLYLMFINPEWFISLANTIFFHGKLTREIYFSVIHLPDNSLLGNFNDEYYKNTHNNNFISIPTDVLTLVLILITAGNSIDHILQNEHPIKNFYKLVVSFVLSYATANLTAICLFTTDKSFFNDTLSLISILGILSLISIGIDLNKENSE